MLKILLKKNLGIYRYWYIERSTVEKHAQDCDIL